MPKSARHLLRGTMKITIDTKNGTTVLHLIGNLDADSVTRFKKQTYQLAEEGCQQFVIDFSDCPFVDSMGLGALISLLRKVRTQQGDVKITRLGKDVATIFEITRLNRLFETVS